MIHVDGSKQSGSGTVVRFAVAYAALLGRPLHLSNARARRDKPGLRPQHVAAVRACAELCGARTEGVEVASREFTFAPGRAIRGGRFAWDIGTAGSTTMLALSVIPIACFARAPLVARITGGVFQDFAPSPHHMQHVLAPLLERMGARVEIDVVRAGYVPRGGGVVELRVRPVRRSLLGLQLLEPGRVRAVSGIAFSSHLEERRVSERMAQVCERQLAAAGLECRIERTLDRLASHPGASLAIWARTSGGCFLGADRAGARGRSSESIGRFVAARFLADRATGASCDRHLADQLVVFGALAEGVTTYIVPRATEHLETNLWLAEQFGARVRTDARRVQLIGLGLSRANTDTKPR
ncbi:MAG: RNA 3'-phosphate cyclase [Deltaproteobacteria bacterium]|nr:MAG: RNA 3'-phosphate cyclase [Deltaproteobacteria bacterium]